MEPVEGLHEAQLVDPVLSPLIRGKKKGCKPTVVSLGNACWDTRHLLQIWDHLMVQNGLLCRLMLVPNDLEENPVIQQVIPRSLQEEVLRELKSWGHIGVAKTLA